MFDYKKDIKININQINFVRLLFATTNKAIRKSEMGYDIFSQLLKNESTLKNNIRKK